MLFIYSLNTEPGQDTHVFTRIVIFMLSSKEPDESAIVKWNIDQNNFCKGGPQISILTWALLRLWMGLRKHTLIQFSLSNFQSWNK